MTPFLSICIPTFNRSQFLKAALESIVNDPIFRETDRVEVVLSDNHSTDGTREVCAPFVERFPDKVHYEFLETPISGDENFIKALNRGKGTFLKLHNDRLIFKEGGLALLLETLEKREECSVFCCTNGLEYWNIPTVAGTAVFHGFEEFMYHLGYMPTWIGGLCFKAEEYRKVENPTKYSHLHFGQIYIISEMLGHGEAGCALTTVFQYDHPDFVQHRTFSIPRVFATDFNALMKILVDEQLLTPATWARIRYLYLPIINTTFIDEVPWNPVKIADYLWNMLPVYWKTKKFYLLLPKVFFSPFFRNR